VGRRPCHGPVSYPLPFLPSYLPPMEQITAVAGPHEIAAGLLEGVVTLLLAALCGALAARYHRIVFRW